MKIALKIFMDLVLLVATNVTFPKKKLEKQIVVDIITSLFLNMNWDSII